MLERTQRHDPPDDGHLPDVVPGEVRHEGVEARHGLGLVVVRHHAAHGHQAVPRLARVDTHPISGC